MIASGMIRKITISLYLWIPQKNIRAKKENWNISNLIIIMPLAIVRILSFVYGRWNSARNKGDI